MDITDRKNRILWIAPYPNSSDDHGAPWILALAKALSTSVQLSILTVNPGQEEEETVEPVGDYHVIRLRSNSKKFDLLTFHQFKIHKIRNWVKARISEFDLIHVHGLEHQYERALVGLNIPVVISIQGILTLTYPNVPDTYRTLRWQWKLNSLFERKSVTQFTNFICRTHWDRKFINSLNSKATIHQAWEMIRREFFIHDLPSSQRGRNILFMGGDHPIKGLPEALRAFNKLVIKNPSLTMSIAGSVAMESVISVIEGEKLNNIDVNHQIVILGRLDAQELVEQMITSLCLLHPTYVDNSPNSVCEAQVLGLPVVASDVGGVSSLIEHERTGLLCDLTTDSISQQIEELIHNPKLIAEISTSSRKMARERHDPYQIESRYLELYKELMN